MHVFGFDTEKAFDYENGFYLTSDVRRLGKLVAHFELYKRIVDLHGAVVECGVFKGASLIRWATFREVLESPYSRPIIGFDIFGAFPTQANVEDEAYARGHDAAAGVGISRDELLRVLEAKRIGNVELVAGNIVTTVPEYAARDGALRIALLHIDVDVYEPTSAVLHALYERVVPGGIIVLDDYGTVAGETRAVDEFFAGKGVTFRKLPCSHVPTYIVKGV